MSAVDYNKQGGGAKEAGGSNAVGVGASQTRHPQLPSSMMDPFVAVDMSGHITDSNESFREMVGYTSEELGALTYRDITPEKWHAVQARIMEDQVLKQGYSEIFEKEYRR